MTASASLALTLVPQRHALFLDIDGTLLDFAAAPDLVIVPPELLCCLETLHVALGGALALISGRTLEVIDTLFPKNFPAAGVHGAQWRLNKKVETLLPLSNVVRETAANSFGNLSGLTLEDKGCAFAVHYRTLPEARHEVLERLTQIVARYSAHDGVPLRLIDGHLVAEIMPTIADKGHALRRFLDHHPFQGKRPVFLGDDTTDIPAIIAAQELGGYGMRVGAGTNVPPERVRAWIKHESTRLAIE